MTDNTENVLLTDDTAPDSSCVTTDNPVENSEAQTSAAGKEEQKPSSNDQDSETGKNKKGHPRGAEQRLIRKLNRKVSEAEKRDLENRALIEEMQAKIDGLAEASAKKANPEPELEDFKTPKEYAEAYSKWAKDQEKPRESSPPKKASPPKKSEPAQEAAPTPSEEELKKFKNLGQERLGDEFLEALDEEIAINQMMGEYILDSDVGPEIYVHLANNPEEALKIYDSSSYRASKALEKLAKQAEKGELDTPAPIIKKDESEKTKKKEKPSPPSTREPGSVKVDKNADDMDMDEYYSMRRKQQKDRNGYYR